MFIARWEFTCRFGKVDDCVSILRKWEMDVGNRVGWKATSVRVLTGFLGGNDSHLEFEAHAENLTDLEGVFNDIDRNPHHREYMRQLEHVIVSGTSKWTVLREVKVIPD
ncbi:Hypothetical protein A7982_11002 [Minicystis rosea]|nr:Hypothetical protein A7982_11002 [Minicystis rosea]